MAVINDLTSTSISDSLSANMGRELNEYIEDVEAYVSEVENSVPTIAVGQTTTGATANVTNSGTATDIVLDFTIPSGGSSNNSVTTIWS